VAILILALATGFTLSVALLAARLLRTGRPSLDAALLGFSWILITTFYMLAHGLVGALTSNGIAASSAAGLAVILLIRPARQLWGASWIDVRAGAKQLRSGWAQLPLWLRVLTWAALTLGSVRFTFLIWALPPFVWDSLTYHLTNVAHWIQAGRIEVFDAPVLRIYSPANYEVFATWFAVFFHHDGWVEASGLPAYMLIVLAVYAVARRLGLSRSASGIAASPAAWMPCAASMSVRSSSSRIEASLSLPLRSRLTPLRERRRTNSPFTSKPFSA